jgi:magnesium-transporting ATPase (P-type)
MCPYIAEVFRVDNVQNKDAFNTAHYQENLALCKDTRAQRKKYSEHAERIVKLWLTFVVVMVTLTGIANFFDKNFVPEKILIAIIVSGTAISVGLFAIVLRGLFLKKS